MSQNAVCKGASWCERDDLYASGLCYLHYGRLMYYKRLKASGKLAHTSLAQYLAQPIQIKNPQRTCSSSNCNSPHYALGRCRKCYNREHYAKKKRIAQKLQAQKHAAKAPRKA